MGEELELNCLQMSEIGIIYLCLRNFKHWQDTQFINSDHESECP